MRYLVCLKPNPDLESTRELNKKISRESNLVLPSSGLHITLWHLSMNEEKESELIDRLKAIKSTDFTATIREAHTFSTDGTSHVLTLSKNPELQILHEQVAEVLGSFDRNQEIFDEILEKYGKQNYIPHLTISKQQDFRFTQDYSGLRLAFKDFYLMKKRDGTWRDIQRLGL